MAEKPYKRPADGERFDFHGINTVLPPDKIPAGQHPYAQNVRRYRVDQIMPRATQDSTLFSLGGNSVHSLRRLNDMTPAGAAGGYVIVAGAATSLYVNNSSVDTGYSGNQLNMLPYRPPASVQPWMYVADSNKMTKVNSNKTTYRVGVAEPQTAPTVSSTPVTSNGIALVGPVTVYYWGDSPHSGPVATYIWRNPGDTAGTGPTRTIGTANGSATGSSLLFDTPGGGSTGSTAVPWTQFQTLNGTVNTSGTAVTWVSGDQFSNLTGGDFFTINNVQYVISVVGGATSITLTSSAGTQSGATYFAVANIGTVPLYQPALESEGYQDFNVCIVASLYVPVAGQYTITLSFKDDIIWGIGNSATGTVTVVSNSGVKSVTGQTRTVVNGFPLLKLTRESSGEAGFTGSASATLSFSQAGNYPIEVDWDYWFHTGRGLTVLASPLGGGTPQNIQPITDQTIMSAQYRYTYRSSATGATSNPSPASTQSTIASVANSLSGVASSDSQVDKIDWYRLDTGLTSFTYVGTGPNSSATFQDLLLDAAVSTNPVLEFDNFEPFPSIDLPRSGTVNSDGNGNITWVSGDQFNTRWLPGTVIVIGNVGAGPNQGTAYTLYNRPTSATTLKAATSQIVTGVVTTIYPPTGTSLAYNISEPKLAAQRLPYIFGPTDNVAFYFGVGDTLRLGTLYWSKGNNFDSAPDTNQQDVTSPSEPLMNGVITNGIGFAMSTERGFLIYPNFFNAEATVDGTVGATWTVQESVSERGLYIQNCIAVDGGGNVFFRAKDGIRISPGGQGSKSITDDIFNLFPHEGFDPAPIIRGSRVIYPPDDTRPSAQSFTVANGYLYYDYQDIDGNPRTLTFDIFAGGWVVDVYQHTVNVHMLQEGEGVNGVLTGCTDGTIRPMVDSGTESATSVVQTRAFIAGDVRGQKHFGDCYIEAGNRNS